MIKSDLSSSGILDIPSDATCTSRPQSWHIPREASVCPLSIMATHYARSATDKTTDTREKDPVRCKLYDARALFARQSMGRETIMAEVNYLKGKDKKAPFSYLREDQEPSMQINTVFGNMSLGSCLSYQLQDFGRPRTKFFSTRNIVKPANFPCHAVDIQAFPLCYLARQHMILENFQKILLPTAEIIYQLNQLKLTTWRRQQSCKVNAKNG